MKKIAMRTSLWAAAALALGAVMPFVAAAPAAAAQPVLSGTWQLVLCLNPDKVCNVTGAGLCAQFTKVPGLVGQLPNSGTWKLSGAGALVGRWLQNGDLVQFNRGESKIHFIYRSAEWSNPLGRHLLHGRTSLKRRCGYRDMACRQNRFMSGSRAAPEVQPRDQRSALTPKEGYRLCGRCNRGDPERVGREPRTGRFPACGRHPKQPHSGRHHQRRLGVSGVRQRLG
jgi:hypothetical protein